MARATLKRIYTVVTQRKPDGIVDVHPYDAMLSPALAYATTYWNGEQLTRGKPFKPDALPLDRFRTEFMGANWGVPADLLYYVIGDYRKSCGLALIHDVPVRVENLKDFALQANLWRLRDRFDCKHADWHPYWSNGELASVSPKGAHVSLHKHSKNGILAIVANFSREKQSIRLQLNAARLGLPANVEAKDGLSAEAIPVKNGTISFPLDSQDWRTIWIRPISPAGGER